MGEQDALSGSTVVASFIILGTASLLSLILIIWWFVRQEGRRRAEEKFLAERRQRLHDARQEKVRRANEHHNPSETEKEVDDDDDLVGSARWKPNNDAHNVKFAKALYGTSDFEKGSLLGSGAFGDVYRVKRKGHTFALKTVAKEQTVVYGDPTYAFAEREVMLRCRHPYIIRLYGTFQDARHLYYVMDYVEGGSLNLLLKHPSNRAGLPLSAVRQVAAQLFLALDCVHRHDAFHRDVKPENIFLTREKGHIVLADFGLAKDFDMEALQQSTTQTIVGTPLCMAPEVLDGTKYDSSADWWSFGCVVFLLIHGRYPFEGRSIGDIRKAIKSGVKFPAQARPAESLHGLNSFLAEVLREDPSQRLTAGGIRNHFGLWGEDFDWQLVGDSLRCPRLACDRLDEKEIRRAAKQRIVPQNQRLDGAVNSRDEQMFRGFTLQSALPEVA